MKQDTRDALLLVLGAGGLLAFLTLAPVIYEWAALKAARVIALALHRP